MDRLNREGLWLPTSPMGSLHAQVSCMASARNLPEASHLTASCEVPTALPWAF